MGHCGTWGAILSAAAQVLDCDVIIFRISCDNKNSADSLSLLSSLFS